MELHFVLGRHFVFLEKSNSLHIFIVTISPYSDEARFPADQSWCYINLFYNLCYYSTAVNLVHLKQGTIPLHLAAENGHTEAVSILISKSAAQLNAKDNLGRTPLHMAAANGHAELLTLLISQGSDVNVQDNVCIIKDMNQKSQ